MTYPVGEDEGIGNFRRLKWMLMSGSRNLGWVERLQPDDVEQRGL